MSTAAAKAAVIAPSGHVFGCPADGIDHVEPAEPTTLPELYVPEVSQWLSTSASRLAFDGYSFMQAVLWVAGSGLYDPRRHQKFGPRAFDVSTIRIAQELAQFTQCRPGIEFLMKRTGLGKRAVEYHLRMLRETGLIARIGKGTRLSGGKRKASEFALMIPPEFDAALGIRTVQRHEAAPDYIRAVAGISEAGRKLMAKLGEKASRRVRKPRKKTISKRPSKAPKPVPATGPQDAGSATEGTVSGEARCTPMQSGTSTVPTAGSTPHPSEGKLASGKPTSPSSKKTKRGPRKLNKTGRRHQLAGELMRRVPWLRSASRDRISWVVSEAADAGWTCDEVLACLDLRQQPPNGVRRASGFLAARLRGMTTMPGWTTRKQRNLQVDHRNAAVDATRKNNIKQERDQQERSESDWQPPTSPKVQRLVDDVFTQVMTPKSTTSDQAEGLPELAGPQNLTEAELREMRRAAAAELMTGETTLIGLAVEAWGVAGAELIYGANLVHRARLLDRMTSLTTPGTGRGQQ